MSVSRSWSVYIFFPLFRAISTNFSQARGRPQTAEAAGVHALSPDGRTAREQLQLIRKAVLPMYATMTSLWEKSLRPQLAECANIRILSYDDLSQQQKERLHRYFEANIFPILTPLAVDPGHPFPFISNLSLSLAILLRHPKRGTEHFARVKVPTSQGGGCRWKSLITTLPLEQVIQHNLHELLRGMEVEHAHAFQITRNADIDRDEEEADDLIEMMSDELRERRFAPVVRLEVEQDMPPRVRELLMRELSLSADDVYVSTGLIDHSDCAFFYHLNGIGFKYKPFRSVIPARLQFEGESEDSPTFFRSSVTEMSLCIIPMNRFGAACNDSSRRPQKTLACWPSSRRCTAPPKNLRLSTP